MQGKAATMMQLFVDPGNRTKPNVLTIKAVSSFSFSPKHVFHMWTLSNSTHFCTLKESPRGSHCRLQHGLTKPKLSKIFARKDGFNCKGDKKVFSHLFRTTKSSSTNSANCCGTGPWFFSKCFVWKSDGLKNWFLLSLCSLRMCCISRRYCQKTVRCFF